MCLGIFLLKASNNEKPGLLLEVLGYTPRLRQDGELLECSEQCHG